MSDHVPDPEKLFNLWGSIGGVGVFLGSLILGLLGYSKSKRADGGEAVAAHVDPRDAEIATLRKEIEARQFRESLEQVMKATREAIYFKLEQGFSGLRADIALARGQVEDFKAEIVDEVQTLGKKVEDAGDKVDDVTGKLAEIERRLPVRR